MEDEESPSPTRRFGEPETRSRVQTMLEQLQTHDLSKTCISLGMQVDPDGLASQLAMLRILESWGYTATCVHRGNFLFPQNKAMRNVLGLSNVKNEIAVKEEMEKTGETFTCVIAVDGNSASAPYPPHFIIDHHEPKDEALIYSDVRENMGSCSAIMWEYAKAAEIDFTTEAGNLLATALAIGIATDTRWGQNPARKLDFEALADCLAHKNDKAYSHIVDYPIPEYYNDSLVRAWDSRVKDGTVLITGLGVIPEARMAVVPYVADSMLCVEGIQTTVVFALVQKDNGTHVVTISARSRSIDVGELINVVFPGKGGGRSGAGRATIKIPLLSASKGAEDKLYQWVECSIREQVSKHTGDRGNLTG